MREVCANCWLWEFEGHRDDHNERYGVCGHAIIDGDEDASPASPMLLKHNGPEYAKRVVYAQLLTHEEFRCKDWDSLVERQIEERGVFK